MSRYENVTSWSGRRRHYAEPGAVYILCAKGTVVRPGDRYVAVHVHRRLPSMRSRERILTCPIYMKTSPNS